MALCRGQGGGLTTGRESDKGELQRLELQRWMLL